MSDGSYGHPAIGSLYRGTRYGAVLSQQVHVHTGDKCAETAPSSHAAASWLIGWTRTRGRHAQSSSKRMRMGLQHDHHVGTRRGGVKRARGRQCVTVTVSQPLQGVSGTGSGNVYRRRQSTTMGT